MTQERNVNEGLSKGRGMTQHSQTSSEANCSGGNLGIGKRPVEHEDNSGGQTRPLKGQDLRIINTGTNFTNRADVVTGDIGYTLVRGFKWKGKTTITSSNLERLKAEKVIQTRSVAAANAANRQGKTTSSRKTFFPWKLVIFMLSCLF
ncbi:hypothetical protein EJD97_016555 [Solanum chilense]|uniref:Uncharacterized protein n=1 Tax=Solanum chilense TaxID=4083 RepID=A0A6N2AEX4_SOLCI|nr:hypothetical protein EJD97_016555 [Solanum chilense]